MCIWMLSWLDAATSHPEMASAGLSIPGRYQGQLRGNIGAAVGLMKSAAGEVDSGWPASVHAAFICAAQGSP